MNDMGYAKRLARDLPRWQQQGWISDEGGRAIFAEISPRQPGLVWASTLALIGAILLGVGVITWFAAHWNEMPKLMKLALIVTSLIASYVAYGLCQSRFALPKLAQAIVLLSVLIFGAAIMLIGQIYHIDAHFPDGIALWAAGALLTAWLLSSQPAMVVSIALAALWTLAEQFNYQALNWPLLIYLLFAAAVLLRQDWNMAARYWGVLFIIWILGWHAQLWGGEVLDEHAHVRLLAIQVLGIAGCWAFAQMSEHPFVRAMRADFLLAALIGTFVFTFPKITGFGSGAAVDLLPWLAALAGVGLIYLTGILRLVRASELPFNRLRIGIVLAIGFGLMLMVEVIVPRTGSLPALLWNLLFLAVLYWVGDLAIRHGDRIMLNRVFVGFSIWLLARYFDTFWSLLDRSLFFIAGGVLLLAGGGWLEHKRRALLRGMDGKGLS